MKTREISIINWFIASIGLTILYIILSLTFGANKAEAAPSCFNNAGLRAGARNVTNVFPRPGISVNQSGCGGVSASQYVLISSYYHNGSGAPGSTLHTPDAYFKIMHAGQPTGAVNIIIARDADGRCNWTSGNDVVVLDSAGTFRGALDSTTLISFDVPASEFVAASQYGQNIWVWNRTIQVAGNAGTSVHCRIQAASFTAGTYVTLIEDGNPGGAHGEAFQRYNQNNAGTGGGSKRKLGPASSFANGSSVSLYADLDNTRLEYAIPFKMRCDQLSAQNISIRYYDPDSSHPANPFGTSQPDPHMGVSVYNESTGALVYDNPNITEGNDEYGEFRITTQPDTVYTIVWYNVWARNGIQFWMPFSEMPAANGVSCPNPNTPPWGSIGASCSASGVLTVWVTVNDRESAVVTVSLSIPTVGNVNRNVGRGTTTIGAWGGRPQDGITKTVTGTVSDGQFAPWLNPSGSFVCEPPPVTIRGRVFASFNNQPIAGVTINTCVAGVSATTNASGDYSFVIRRGTGFCIRLAALPAGSANRHVEITSGPAYPQCGATNPTYGYCQATSYENQLAGLPAGNGWDRHGTTVDDHGYSLSITYVPVATCAINGGGAVGETGTPYMPNMTSTRSGDTRRPPVNGTASFSISGVPGSNRSAAYPVIGSAGGSTTYNLPPPVPIPAGTFTMNGSISSIYGQGQWYQLVGPSDGCTSSISAGEMPYLKVFGGDVWAGGGFTGSCSPANSGVYGFAREVVEGSNRYYRGASGQLTVTALARVVGFYSVSERDRALGGNTWPPTDLTFANSPSTLISGTDPVRRLGGQFGAAGICLTDYFTRTRDPAISQNIAAALPPTGGFAAGRRQYVVSGDLTIGALSIPAGRQAAVYVNGDVYITGNILYNTSSPRNSVNDIPYFALVVCGNIFINNNVRQIDGLYVAQPTTPGGNCTRASAGTIYTCAEGMRNLMEDNELLAQCDNQQLSVNGAFVAQTVKFLRSVSSLRFSARGEKPNFANGQGTNAAEVINYSPEMFLAPSPLRDPEEPTLSTSTREFDSILSLPPSF